MAKDDEYFVTAPFNTKSKYFSHIRQILRRGWNKFPSKTELINRDRVRMENKLTGKQAYHAQCEHCKEWFPVKYMCVDHIDPCGSLKDYNDLPKFVENMFCGVDNLQKLCNYTLKDKELFGGEPSCHYKKSQEERKERNKK